LKSNNNRHETLIKLKIDVVFAKRWQRTSRIRDWNCTKSWLNQKMFSSRTYVQNALSSQIICSFNECQSCYHLIVFVIIFNKRSSTCCFFCNDRTANKQNMFKDDETTNLRKLLNIEKRLKTSINWLMKINLLTKFSLIKTCLK
jgi:hypothetical protein